MSKPVLSPSGWTLTLLLAASPLFAQSGQVLRGGVQQNPNRPSDQQVQTTVLDMYHQLSIMWGNPSASQAAQKTFQQDVTQFGGYVSAGSALASKLAPCVNNYQQAYPHVVLQSKYYTQNNSTAFNSEGAIANPLIKAGASCVSTATADQFASNGGKTYNTYQAPRSLGPAPVYQAPSGAWMPRCETLTSTNCYLWLLNRNGLYDHIYQGGPPNCSKGPPGGYDPSQNPAWEGLGGNGGPDTPAPPAGNSNNSQPCAIPDWVRQYQAQGASPPLRYQVGFNQGVARCLQSKCTVQNLAIAVWAAAFPKVRVVLGIAQAAGFISAVIHPPGFSPDPDPYVRGNQEGERLCNWLLQLLVPAKVRPGPVVGPNGRISIPKGFNPREAMNTIKEWLPQINPSACDRNCAPAAVNSVRVLFGQPLEAAPETTRGWTDQEVEAAVGAKFSNAPVTGPAMDEILGKLPDGTVVIIGATNPNYGGTTPPGPLKSINDVPGHSFFAIKNGTGVNSVEYWDGQTGKETAELPGDWFYHLMIVGNPLRP